MEQHYDATVLDFCHRLPKVELHAHLNGCVKPETLKRLIQERGISLSADQQQELDRTGPRDLAACFALFNIIHQITTTHEAISGIATEVVSDFAADGVIYLELRTTPKARPECGMTKRSYVEAVLAGLEAHGSCWRVPDVANGLEPSAAAWSSRGAQQQQQQQQQQQAPAILVKLLLSIDRREGPEAAMETVKLASEFPGRVVGIDLSGNPSTGDWSSWEPALQHARQLGLKVTLHAAEVFAPDETHAMLDFRPDRLGHMCRLDVQLEAKLIASRIPVELCLTSNLLTSTVPTYADHHFSQLRAAGAPVVLCTDDSGFFGTTLAKEYAIAAKAFGLGREALAQLVIASLDYLFCSSAERQWVQEKALAVLASSPSHTVG